MKFFTKIFVLGTALAIPVMAADAAARVRAAARVHDFATSMTPDEYRIYEDNHAFIGACLEGQLDTARGLVAKVNQKSIDRALSSCAINLNLESIKFLCSEANPTQAAIHEVIQEINSRKIHEQGYGNSKNIKVCDEMLSILNNTVK